MTDATLTDAERDLIHSTGSIATGGPLDGTFVADQRALVEAFGTVIADRVAAAKVEALGERDYWQASAERCLAELRATRRERDDLRARYEALTTEDANELLFPPAEQTGENDG